MKVYINDKITETLSPTLGEWAKNEFGVSSGKGFALAVNNSVVPNSNWNSFVLNEGDKILVVQAAQGG